MISVVIPALNEKDAIAETIRAVREVLTAAGITPFETIVVDDGSSDGTGAIARAEGARVIRHPHRAGYGRSLKDGIRAASFETIAITDADGSYAISDIPKLYRSQLEGFDMTVGARSGKHYRESLLKLPLRWVLRKLVEFTAARSVPDINSGLRLFNKSTIIPYFDHLCDTFSFTTSLTLAYIMTGRFVVYVSIGYGKRLGRTKVKLFRDAILTFQYILEAAIFFNPLRIFLLVGGLVFASGLLSLVAALVVRLNVLFFVGVGAIVSAILILSMGLLAVLLRQIAIKSMNWDFNAPVHTSPGPENLTINIDGPAEPRLRP